MSKNPQKSYQCRNEGCRLGYTLPQNRLRHENLSGHMPQKRRDWNKALYDAELKMFKCSFSNYCVSKKQKLDLKRHIITFQVIKKQKHSKLTYMPILQSNIFSKIQS